MTRGWHGERRRHQLAARGIKTRPEILRAEGVLTDIAEYPTSISIDYNDPQEIFALFWACSQAGDFSNFDFDQAYDRALARVYYQLKQHGLLGPEEYKEYLKEVYPWPISLDELYAASGFLDWDSNKDIEAMIFDGLVKSEEFKEFQKENEWEGPQSLESWVISWTTSNSDAPLPEAVADELVALQSQEWSKRLLEDSGFLVDHNPAYNNLMELYEDLQNPPKGLQDRVLLMDRVIHAQHLGGTLWEELDINRLRSKVEAASRRASRRRGEAY